MKERYEAIVNKILNDDRFSVFKISEEERNTLLEKLNYINEIVMLINDNDSNHNLYSSQLIAWIVYDFLRSVGSIEE